MFLIVTQTIRVRQSILKATGVRLLHTARIANGGHIEIGTMPGLFTNFLKTTANSSGDWFPVIDSMFAWDLTWAAFACA
jgi:hypothetical protein